LRIKEQGTHLALNEHDGDDDDEYIYIYIYIYTYMELNVSAIFFRHFQGAVIYTNDIHTVNISFLNQRSLKMTKINN